VPPRASPCLTVGRRASATAHARFVLDDPDQAVHDRAPLSNGAFTHRSGRGSRHSFVKNSERRTQWIEQDDSIHQILAW
jgi:hypothetical protein